MPSAFSLARSLVALVSIVFLSACSNEPSVVRYSEAKPEESGPAEAQPASRPSSGVSYDTPEEWQPGRPSSMRLASFSIPLDGETADVSLVKLAGSAGGLMANVNRWRGQINLRPVTESGLETLLEERQAKGDEGYQYLRLTNEQTNQSILAGIYTQSGFTLFAKLTASTDGAKRAEDSFMAFCDSVSFESGEY